MGDCADPAGQPGRRHHDGCKWIAYWDGEPAALRFLFGKVYVMPTSGGNSKQVAERATPAVWSPDSRRLLYGGDTGDGTFRMDWFTAPVEGGAVE